MCKIYNIIHCSLSSSLSLTLKERIIVWGSNCNLKKFRKSDYRQLYSLLHCADLLERDKYHITLRILQLKDHNSCVQNNSFEIPTPKKLSDYLRKLNYLHNSLLQIKLEWHKYSLSRSML